MPLKLNYMSYNLSETSSCLRRRSLRSKFKAPSPISDSQPTIAITQCKGGRTKINLNVSTTFRVEQNLRKTNMRHGSVRLFSRRVYHESKHFSDKISDVDGERIVRERKVIIIYFDLTSTSSVSVAFYLWLRKGPN